MRRCERGLQLGRGLVVGLTGLLVLGAASEAEAVFACLPARNCQSVESCCRKPRLELWLQIARAELRRDFYKSEKNRQEAFDKGSWDSANSLEKAFEAHIQSKQDSGAKKRLGMKANKQYGDVPTLVTDKKCKTFVEENGAPLSPKDIPKLFDDPKSPLTRADVCKEAVAAAVRHEEEHQDRCEAKRNGLGKPPKPGTGVARQELDEHADAEEEAYAREAAMLRLYARQARRRCTTAKALAADDFENAKQKLEALALMRHPRTL